MKTIAIAATAAVIIIFASLALGIRAELKSERRMKEWAQHDADYWHSMYIEERHGIPPASPTSSISSQPTEPAQ